MSKSWSPKVGWFNDNYALRVLSASFGPSGKGTPMITLELEVASPESAFINGEEYTVAGVKMKHYITTQSRKDGVVDEFKTEKMKGRIEEAYKAFGIPFDTFNPENPDVSGFEGKTVWAFVEHDENVLRKTQTAEQKANGQLGDVAINPVTGEKSQTFYPKVKEFYGIAKL